MVDVPDILWALGGGWMDFQSWDEESTEYQDRDQNLNEAEGSHQTVRLNGIDIRVGRTGRV